ncbi:MAG: M48 family metalloprotease [Chloroflexota bacterium]
MYEQTSRRTRRSGGGRFSVGRIMIALVIAAMSVFAYYASSEFNPVTDETQQVALSQEQEVAMGLQAAPEMAQMYGGLLQDPALQQQLDNVCQKIASGSEVGTTEWPFECHLLSDQETTNAFALPGGQLFITAALFNELQTEGQLAGVMAQLAQGLSGAAVFAAYDPNNPDSGATAQQVAAVISRLVTLKYGREDELQSDRLGVQFMSDAGYDPRAMVSVMKILANSGGPAGQPEFFSTHPNPENRIGRIVEAIQTQFPNGVPEGLIQ